MLEKVSRLLNLTVLLRWKKVSYTQLKPLEALESNINIYLTYIFNFTEAQFMKKAKLLIT